MLNIKELMDIISENKECNIIPSIINNKIEDKLLLPNDLKEFYLICNGIELFPMSSTYPYKILGIQDIKQANMIIIGEPCYDDISSQWYTIAEDYNGDYLSIDLSENKLGCCYDSYHETHGLVGDTPVIAKSFTELLNNLFYSYGNNIYWHQKNFIKNGYGDAYDR